MLPSNIKFKVSLYLIVALSLAMVPFTANEAALCWFA